MDERWLYAPLSVDNLPIETVRISAIRLGASPRLDGENPEHSMALAEVQDELPPIVVHRQTMRVIDGVHRLSAARMRSRREIRARFYDGDEEAAWVIGLKLNMAHGLPLTLADRKAVASQILTGHPDWSDRSIAAASGLAPSTVASVRGSIAGKIGRPRARVGRDGRVRPLSSAEARRHAGALLSGNPGASLREIARKAGIAPATVRDVQQQLHRSSAAGLSRAVPETDRRTPHSRKKRRLNGTQRPAREARCIVDILRRDPSMRLKESGRSLLTWLDAHVVGAADLPCLADNIPPHCVGLLAELAHACGREWIAFAEELQRRAA